MKIVAISTLCLSAAIISGCQTTQVEEKIFVRTDGKRARDNPVYEQQYNLDFTICKGEAQKVAAGAAPVYSNGSLASEISAAQVNNQRGNALVDVVEGCMASKGYVYVPVSQAMDTHLRFKANPIKRPS